LADTDGRVFTGVLASETATSVTLRASEPAVTEAAVGKVVERTVLRKDIEAMKASDQSLMPEDLKKEMTPRDAADLVAYLRQTLGPVSPPVRTLFEDDASFVAALDQGAGRAVLEESDRFSGASSLLVTPPQRFSPRLPGWQYHITEKPGPGQFRYMRFAWKSRGGAGVMIELAAAGGWPRADQPVRRYYSGRNTTAWKAMQVSGQVPTEWTVVTRDLWQDCGEFVLTGIAPTAMGGAALFDRIELLRSLDPVLPARTEAGKR